MAYVGPTHCTDKIIRPSKPYCFQRKVDKLLLVWYSEQMNVLTDCDFFNHDIFEFTGIPRFSFL